MTPSTEVHHILPLEKGGTHNEDNLMALCKPCHSRITAEMGEGESVPVAVWEVSERDELRLDRYEGYPTFYYKKDVKISYTGIASGKLRKKKAFVSSCTRIDHSDAPPTIISRSVRGATVSSTLTSTD